MKALLGVPRVITWFDAIGAVSSPELVTISLEYGSTTTVLNISQNIDVPSLFVSSAVTLSNAGTYTATVTYDGTVIDSFPIVVTSDVTPDVALNNAQPLRGLPEVCGSPSATRKLYAQVIPLEGTVVISPAAPAAVSVGAQHDGAVALPSNTTSVHYYVVTSSGVHATIGQLVYDNGSGAGTAAIVATLSNRIAVTAPLTGGTIEFAANKEYLWDTAATAAWVPAGPVEQDATTAALVRYTETEDDFYTLASFLFSAPGPYTLVWYESLFVDGAWTTPAAFDTQDVFALHAVGSETVWLYAATPEPASIPIDGATVVISSLDSVGVLTQVGIGTTGGDGFLVLSLPPGVFVASLLRAGDVFSVNNFTITVVNTRLEEWDNTFALATDYVTPTVSPVASSAARCLITAQLFRMDGSALAHADVQVALVTPAMTAITAGVSGGRQRYKTDSNGYVEFYLLRGLRVEVAVASMGLRRIIVVPDQPGPVNLLALMAASPDLYNVITPVIPAAPKRSL